MALSQTHRPSALKQSNKKHHTLGHRSKGSISKANRGRVSVKTLSKKNKSELSREQRKNKNRQVRALKREEAAARKRALGSAHQPPFLVSVVPLSPIVNPRIVLAALVACDKAAITTTSPQGVTHISSPRFKKRFSFVIPPVNDLYAILDSIKVSDTLMLLWPAEEELGDAAELLISSVLSQGLPTPIHIITGLEELGQKGSTSSADVMEMESLEEELRARLSLHHLPHNKNLHRQNRARQRLTREIELLFPGSARVLSTAMPQEALLVLRHIGQQKQRPVYFRDHRPHLMTESMQFVEEGSTGTLKLEGYVRGRELSVNDLVHIPGWGDYQMTRIDFRTDPYPLVLRRDGHTQVDHETYLLEEADPTKQESLTATNEIDVMEGEQTWPTEEEEAEAESASKAALTATKTRTKRVPRGTSAYQAAWIIDSDQEEGSVGDDDSCIMEDDKNLAPVDTLSQDGSQQATEEEEDEEEYETVTVEETEGVHYDEKMDYGAEMDTLQKMKVAKEDKMFPDEMDTPRDIGARVRFQKFRGLQSFRTSTWHPDENLPLDYARIFQFNNFNYTRKRVMREEREGVLPGWYVVIHILDVPRHLYDQHVSSHSPLVVFGLLPHEQKMSVVNMAVRSHQAGHFRPIKSKERLIFHMGFRRFASCPIFSEHSTGNKHKFARYFHPKTTVVATTFAPITFPPASVLVFRERPDGAQDLVATGSLLSMDPRRIVTKRAVLSGHPFKVNRKTAVVRYMFFNREDVLWFKPVELRTKWGRRGHIKEPLGTHGHMKCYFDGQLKSQDTVLLNLYKRVFPKWTFDPHVSRPPPLYTFHSHHDMDEAHSEEEEHQPAMKRAKVVKFFTSGD